jgi:Ca2+-binding EF-hand superfamily protein
MKSGGKGPMQVDHEQQAQDLRSYKSNRSTVSNLASDDRSTLSRNTKTVLKIFESQYLSPEETITADAHSVSKQLLKEAMSLAGLHHFKPSQAMVNSFAQLLDQDNDGVIGPKDLESRIDYFLTGCPSNDNYHSGTSRSCKSASNLMLLVNNERATLKKNLADKVPGGVDNLVAECKRYFDKFDFAGDNTVEYDNLIGLLTEVYALFGMNFKPSPQDSRRYIEVIDSDKDGTISWADFELFILRVLESFEGNRDAANANPQATS